MDIKNAPDEIGNNEQKAKKKRYAKIIIKYTKLKFKVLNSEVGCRKRWIGTNGRNWPIPHCPLLRSHSMDIVGRNCMEE